MKINPIDDYCLTYCYMLLKRTKMAGLVSEPICGLAELSFTIEFRDKDNF